MKLLPQPKVSIVVSAYQKANYLSRTLQGVLDQTFTDFEVIVVDDGSTDNSHEIIEGFAQRDSRIKYIYQENQGPGSARNTGIEISQADLVALLDGDDTWLPNKLEHQVQIMDKFPNIDLLLSNYQYIDALEAKQGIQMPNYYHDYILLNFSPRPLQGFDRGYLIGDSDFACQIALKNVFLPTTVIFRKHVWTEIGGFNEELFGPEDLDFWIRAALRKYQFAYTSHVGAIYYKNETSLVQVSEGTYQEQLKHALFAYRSPEYEPIRDTIKKLVHKRFRQLIVFYTYQRKPRKAWKCFCDSSLYGIRIRTLLMAVASFLGPVPLTVYRKTRQFIARWI